MDNDKIDEWQTYLTDQSTIYYCRQKTLM